MSSQALTRNATRRFPHQHLVQGEQLKIMVEEPLEDLSGRSPIIAGERLQEKINKSGT